MTTTTDHQPLTDHQLAEIAQRNDRFHFLAPGGTLVVNMVELTGRDDLDALAKLFGQDVPALLATVELLRRELALLRAELPHMCERVREQAAQELRDRATTLTQENQ